MRSNLRRPLLCRNLLGPLTAQYTSAIYACSPCAQRATEPGRVLFLQEGVFELATEGFCFGKGADLGIEIAEKALGVGIYFFALTVG
jgi:hypothetical protein